MLLTYARAFSLAGVAIEFERGRLNTLLKSDDPITAESDIGANVLSALNYLKTLCLEIPSLNPVAEPIERAEKKIEFGVVPLILYNELEHIQHRVLQELRTHYYYPVTEAYAATYANVSPFGAEVYNNFPSARLDVQEAGKCIVLGQPTAGVFHLMRAMEVALKVLAKDLGVPYRPSWESYIDAINKAIERKHDVKSPAWKKKEAFYKDLLGDLIAIKHAWRNTTMHIDKEYSPDSATRIYQAVAAMMERMAVQGLRERGRPIKVTVALAEGADQ